MVRGCELVWNVVPKNLGGQRARKRARRMQARFKLGLRVLVAALLLLNMSGLCAGTAVTAEPPAHPCCPKAPPAGKSPADCCITSAIPVKAQSGSISNAPDWPHSTLLTGVEAHLRDSRSEVIVPTPISPPEPLFIRFHQFLI